MSIKWADLTPRERDALVAEKVMGESRPTANVPDYVLAGILTSASGGGNWVGTTTGYSSGDDPIWIPRQFTTDIAAAWEVVEAITPGGTGFWLNGKGGGEGWFAEFDSDGNDPLGIEDGAPNPHEAICIAALRAVGVEVET